MTKMDTMLSAETDMDTLIIASSINMMDLMLRDMHGLDMTDEDSIDLVSMKTEEIEMESICAVYKKNIK